MENIERFGRANYMEDKTRQDGQNTTHCISRATAGSLRLGLHLEMSQKATFYRNSNAAPQNRGTHFARACAVEMHLEISHGPLDTEIYRENAAPLLEHPDRGPHFARACAVQTHLEISQEPPFTEIYRENAAPETGAHTLC